METISSCTEKQMHWNYLWKAFIWRKKGKIQQWARALVLTIKPALHWPFLYY